jgi:hypothetical protein
VAHSAAWPNTGVKHQPVTEATPVTTHVARKTGIPRRRLSASYAEVLSALIPGVPNEFDTKDVASDSVNTVDSGRSHEVLDSDAAPINRVCR